MKRIIYSICISVSVTLMALGALIIESVPKRINLNEISVAALSDDIEFDIRSVTDYGHYTEISVTAVCYDYAYDYLNYVLGQGRGVYQSVELAVTNDGHTAWKMKTFPVHGESTQVDEADMYRVIGEIPNRYMSSNSTIVLLFSDRDGNQSLCMGGNIHE